MSELLKNRSLTIFFSTHWEDELLLQVSQAFLKQQEEEEDSLFLAVSQDS